MSADDRDGFDWSGWAIPGAAMLVALGLFIVAIAPWTWLTPGPTATPTPSGAQPGEGTGDEHEVVTDEGIVSFRLEGDEIVIRLTVDGATTELGRTTLSFFATGAPGGTPTLTGASMFVLTCEGANGSDARRYVYGHLGAGGDPGYEGPAATGHGASDGMFLFALLPGATPGPVTVTGPDRSSVGYGADVFARASSIGREQPSGCYVVG